MEGEARTDEEDVRDAKETEGRYKSMRVLRNIATKLAVATIGARLLAAAAFGGGRDDFPPHAVDESDGQSGRAGVVVSGAGEG